MIEQDVLQEAINTYGVDHQCLVAMEECAELVQALSKPLRKDFNGRTPKRYAHIAEEIADVELSIACVKQALNLQESVAQIKEQKLSRLWARIKEYKKENNEKIP